MSDLNGVQGNILEATICLRELLLCLIYASTTATTPECAAIDFALPVALPKVSTVQDSLVALKSLLAVLVAVPASSTSGPVCAA